MRLSIVKTSDGNPVSVAENVRKEVEKIKESKVSDLPPDGQKPEGRLKKTKISTKF